MFFNNEEYGTLISYLLTMSGKRNYNLADALGYDVTYISKWITGKRIPSHKISRKINRDISNFIVESLDEFDLEEFYKSFGIDDSTKGNSRNEQLKIYIETKLNEAFSKSYVKKKDPASSQQYTKPDYEQQKTSNSNTIVNHALRRKYLSEMLSEKGEGKDFFEAILMSNLYSVNTADKLYISGIKSIGLNLFRNVPARVKLINDFKLVDTNDIIFNSIFFINMATNKSNIDYEFYSCDFIPYNTIAVVKDVYMHHALYSSPEKCILSTTSTDINIINETYYTLLDTIENQSIKTFESITPLEMIFTNSYLNFISSEDMKILLPMINEMFMPTDLFMELGSELFGKDESTINLLNKIQLFLKTITKKLKIDVLFFDTAIDKYFLTGELMFFNQKIIVEPEQRIKHIEYMKDVFKENKYIDIKVISEEIVQSLKHFKNPTLYMSKRKSFLLSEDNKNNYLIVKDNDLEKSLNLFFSKLWNYNEQYITQEKESLIKTLEQNIIYSQLLLKGFDE